MKVVPNLYNVEIHDSCYWGSDETEFKNHQKKFESMGFLTLADYNPDESYNKLIIEETVVLSDSQVIELAIADIQFKVKQKINVEVDISKQLVELAEKPIRIVTENSGGDTYNNRCEVHMPGQALSLYNEVLLLEDCCTDNLQNSLNTGWRIIAACPQPDNKRPDYILGRFNPVFDGDNRAKRTGIR